MTGGQDWVLWNRKLKKTKSVFPVRFTLSLNYVYVGAVCARVSVGSCNAKKKTPDFLL